MPNIPHLPTQAGAFIETPNKVELLPSWPLHGTRDLPHRSGSTVHVFYLHEIPTGYRVRSNTTGVSVSCDGGPEGTTVPMRSVPTPEGKQVMLEVLGRMIDQGLLHMVQLHVAPLVEQIHYSIHEGLPAATPAQNPARQGIVRTAPAPLPNVAPVVPPPAPRTRQPVAPQVQRPTIQPQSQDDDDDIFNI